MNGDEVDRRVRAVLADTFGLEPDEVGPRVSTDTVEGWDSLQHLAVVLSLEEEFGIHFDDEDTMSLVSYPLITVIVRERLGIPDHDTPANAP